MTEYLFSLMPFPAPALPGVHVLGRIAREQGQLSIHFSLTGNIDEIFFPSAASQPGRRDELWLTTCFEFFLAVQGQPQYWEFNLSPSGHWNIYRMDAYRRIGFREENLLKELQLETWKTWDSFSAAAEVDLKPIVRAGEIVQAGVTSVIQTLAGHETYWALTHPAAQADFHLRESFLLQL